MGPKNSIGDISYNISDMRLSTECMKCKRKRRAETETYPVSAALKK